MKLFYLVSLILCLALTRAASDESFIPLDRYLKTVGQESYVFKRCSALYFNIISYGGDNLEKSVASGYNSAAMTFLKASFAVDMQNNLGEADYVFKLITQQIKSISKIYRKRMDNNYLREGQAMGNDDLIKGDLLICKEISNSFPK